VGGLLHRSPPNALLVPNVTALPSTASVPITVLLYDGPLLYGFNVVIKALIATSNIYLYVSLVPSHNLQQIFTGCMPIMTTNSINAQFT